MRIASPKTSPPLQILQHFTVGIAPIKYGGISDDDHKLIGTTFDPFRQKAKGNQDLLIWLKTHLSHNANYDFSEIYFENKKNRRQRIIFQNSAFVMSIFE